LDTAYLSTHPAAGQASGAPLVSIRRVSKQFANGTIAVRDVDLDLGTGEFISLLGPSGCGKSTLLKAHRRIPFAGLGRSSLKDRGRSPERTKPSADLGLVFQEFDQLLPWAVRYPTSCFALVLTHRAEATQAEAESVRAPRC
jgi:NitT/TauT family transport system ATP-binding protein